MRFGKKMFRLFSFMGILLASVSIFIYARSSVKEERDAELELLQMQAEQISHQMDIAYSQMEFAFNSVISNTEVFQGIETLSSIDIEYANSTEEVNAVKSIRENFSNWFLTKHFHRVIYFSGNGMAIEGSRKINEESTREVLESVGYDQMAGLEKGRYYFWGPHNSPWEKDSQAEVISLILKLRGFQETYMEVEYERNQLNFGEYDDLCFLDKNERCFWEADFLDRQKVMKAVSKGIEMTEIENCFVCIKKSEETGIITVLARKNRIIRCGLTEWYVMFCS